MPLHHNIKKTSAWLLIILALAVLTVLVVLLVTPLTKDRFECSGYLEMESDAQLFSADLNVYLLMDGERNGYFNVSGIVLHNHASFNVERSYRFDYEAQNQGVYHLTHITVSRRDADNAIDAIMDKVFISPDAEHGRYIKIKQTGNAMVIEGVYSPSLMCVLH